jgi:hypothetical protein
MAIRSIALPFDGLVLVEFVMPAEFRFQPQFPAPERRHGAR